MTHHSGVTGKTVPGLRRALDAAKRQAAYEARSPEQQLAILDYRPGASARERARITP